MSANTDDEICEKHIDTLRKLYKIERPLPKHITDDITRVLENIGWCCWFADWINHIVYCWVLEINASKSKPDLPDFINWEDIKSDDESEEDDMRLDEESEDEKKKEDFDEDGFCNSCGWNSCFPNSHIEYSYGVCEYIKKKYGEIGLKDVFEDDEFERPLLTDKKESEDYEYVIKTYDNRNEYLGLFEVSNGNKSWNTEFQARIVFNVAIQLVELGTLILVRIDANSNEDRETIIEKKGRDRIDRY